MPFVKGNKGRPGATAERGLSDRELARWDARLQQILDTRRLGASPELKTEEQKHAAETRQFVKSMRAKLNA